MTRLTNPQKLVAVAVVLIMVFLTVRLLSTHSWNTPEGAERVNLDELHAQIEHGRPNAYDNLIETPSTIGRSPSKACTEARALASFYDSCVEVLKQDADGDCNSLIAPPEGSTIPDNLTEANRYQSSFFQAAARSCKNKQPLHIRLEPISDPNAQVGTP